MANAKRMINLDKCQAVYSGNIESVKWEDGQLENGTPILLGALATGETELFNILVTGSTGALATSEVLIVVCPEVMYRDDLMASDFYVATGAPARAYHMTVGDVFTIPQCTASIISNATAAVGDCVVMNATGMNYVVTAQTAAIASFRFVAKVIELTTIGYDGDAAVSVRVINA